MANEKEKKTIADEQMKQIAGGVMPILYASPNERDAGDFCRPFEEVVLDLNRRTTTVYTCSDPDRKGTKIVCETCRAR